MKDGSTAVGISLFWRAAAHQPGARSRLAQWLEESATASVGINRLPAMAQQPRTAIEGEQIAAAPRRLVVGAADRHALQRRHQQGTYPAMRDDGDAAEGRGGQHRLNGAADAALRVHCP